MKVEINTENLEWWMKPLLASFMLPHDQIEIEEYLKRYAELAGTEVSRATYRKPQELRDKKLLR